ncbi:hypothetical protein VW29_16715 [Devosia limi DSM 17137]|uniref:Enterobactin synthase component D n=1 Tax=Devosia limi DSM 17137 TaxID=1121477 RepID=A0A0F5LEU8_9HYPH|nr:hypothetical protein VW29_16715 [Devosia limi DSM 17137]
MAELVPDGAASARRIPETVGDTLFPEERAAIARAVPRRRAEFIAGRACARHALFRLGQPAMAIPSGPDRAPIWPDGFVGSISHCEDLAIAVVARCPGAIRSLGVDIEPACPLEAELVENICTAAEQRYLANAANAGLLAKTIFSIKESVYKAQYPLTHTMLEFLDVELVLDATAGRFDAVVANSALPPLGGRFRIEAGHILALTYIAA